MDLDSDSNLDSRFLFPITSLLFFFSFFFYLYYKCLKPESDTGEPWMQGFGFEHCGIFIWNPQIHLLQCNMVVGRLYQIYSGLVFRVTIHWKFFFTMTMHLVIRYIREEYFDGIHSIFITLIIFCWCKRPLLDWIWNLTTHCSLPSKYRCHGAV